MRKLLVALLALLASVSLAAAQSSQFNTSYPAGASAVATGVSLGFVDVVSNGAFATDTVWTKGTGWTIGSGHATATTASTALSQTISGLVPGQSYHLSYDATRTAGSVTPNLGGTAGTAQTTDDTFTEDIIAGSSGTLAFTGTGFSGTIDNVTLLANDGTATIPARAGATSYICGFAVNGLGATSATPVVVTAGTLAGSATLRFPYTYALGATATNTVVILENFIPCLPASAANSAVTVTVPKATGNTSTNISVWGYQLPNP